MYGNLFNKIYGVADIATQNDETWIYLFLSGRYDDQCSKSVFSELNEALDEQSKEGCITYKIGGSNLSLEEFLANLDSGSQWSVNLNKLSFMGEGKEISNFFFGLDAFRKWAEKSNPFSGENPINCHRCKIEVNGLQNAFGGPNFLVSGNVVDFPNDRSVTYESDRLKSVLRQFTKTNREIYPEKHYVSFGDVDDYSRPFFRNSLMCFSVALCDELYEDKVVLRGIRRLDFSIESLPHYENEKMVSAQESLREAFCWIYGGDSRYELRHKLLMDRVTLDLPLDLSYYDGIINLISHALRQANERYNFAFFERSAEYQKELQQFLKELHSLCDSYSTKVRSLLGSFLRDALAGFLTVSITIFARVIDLEKLDSGNVLTYIFCAYGFYLAISCFFQIIVDWRDLHLSEKEIDYWKTVSREYMRDEDFEDHKKETVKKRKNWAIRQYVYIGVLYLAFAIFSFNVPHLWKGLSSIEKKTEIQNGQSNIKTAKDDIIKMKNI